MTSADSKSYSDWLLAELAIARTNSHSADFVIRKSANYRVENLAAGIAILQEFLSLDAAHQTSNSKPRITTELIKDQASRFSDIAACGSVSAPSSTS